MARIKKLSLAGLKNKKTEFAAITATENWGGFVKVKDHSGEPKYPAESLIMYLWGQLHAPPQRRNELKLALSCCPLQGRVCSLKWSESHSLCLISCDPRDYTVHARILQARILEWVAFRFSRRSSQLRVLTQVSGIAGGFFTSWVTREAQEYWSG